MRYLMPWHIDSPSLCNPEYSQLCDLIYSRGSHLVLKGLPVSRWTRPSRREPLGLRLTPDMGWRSYLNLASRIKLTGTSADRERDRGSYAPARWADDTQGETYTQAGSGPTLEARENAAGSENPTR